MIRTYAVLEISREAYREIRDKLQQAGYESQIEDRPAGEIIDMHGLAIRIDRNGNCFLQRPDLAKCSDCGSTWSVDHPEMTLACQKCAEVKLHA